MKPKGVIESSPFHMKMKGVGPTICGSSSLLVREMRSDPTNFSIFTNFYPINSLTATEKQ